jgi:hypothetical protein
MRSQFIRTWGSKSKTTELIQAALLTLTHAIVCGTLMK